MTWTTPSTQTTGFLVTATIYNEQIIGDLLHLYNYNHQIDARLYGNSVSVATGDYAYYQINSTNYCMVTFRVPDDFGSLDRASLVMICTSSTAQTIDVTSDYGNPATPENYNQHSESSLSKATSPSINKLVLVDVSDVLSSLAAGDFVTIKVTNGNNTSAGVAGVDLVYSRA